MNQLKDLAGARLDVRKYLQYYEIGVKQVKIAEDGRTAYILNRCPFDPSHQGKDAAIFQDDNGKLGAKCFHDSCAGRGWAEFRNAIGPIRFKEHMIGGGGSSGTILSNPSFSRRTDSKSFDLEVVSNGELFDDPTELRFLIQDVLVEGQPCTLGGASKTLKTSLAVDMAVSVASKGQWLGHFDVLDDGPVFIVSAESGKPVLRDQMKAVCHQKGIDADGARALPIHWSFRRPQLANLAHLNVLAKTLEELEPKLVLLDPSYLLISGAGADSTKNLFAMGEVLGGISDAINQACGGTLILLHHVNKSAGRSVKGNMPMISLGDLAYAGFVEWTRQWLLLSRLTAYAEGSGHHEIHMSAGGSAGHSGSWAMKIDEGQPMAGGRMWEPKVMPFGQWGHDHQREQEESEINTLKTLGGQTVTIPQVAKLLGKTQTGAKEVLERAVTSLQASRSGEARNPVYIFHGEAKTDDERRHDPVQ